MITKLKKCWEVLSQKFDQFQVLSNNSQQHATICNRVCKRTQHVTPNNVGVVGQQCCVRFHGALQRRAFSPVQKTFLLFCRSDQWRIPSCLSVLQCSVAVYPSCMSDRMFLGYKPFSRWPGRQRRTYDSQIQRFLVFKVFNKFVVSWLVFFQV